MDDVLSPDDADNAWQRSAVAVAQWRNDIQRHVPCHVLLPPARWTCTPATEADRSPMLYF